MLFFKIPYSNNQYNRQNAAIYPVLAALPRNRAELFWIISTLLLENEANHWISSCHNKPIDRIDCYYEKLAY